eukprot:scaffold3385_cov119-Isochrysis_galbana.AAC.4
MACRSYESRSEYRTASGVVAVGVQNGWSRMTLRAACKLMPEAWCCELSSSTRGWPGLPKSASARMHCSSEPAMARAGTAAACSSWRRWRTWASHCV